MAHTEASLQAIVHADFTDIVPQPLESIRFMLGMNNLSTEGRNKYSRGNCAKRFVLQKGSPRMRVWQKLKASEFSPF